MMRVNGARRVRIEGAEFAAGLDSTGVSTGPAPAFSNELESLSIDRLDIVDSRVVFAEHREQLADRARKTGFPWRAAVPDGPIKGEGGFELAVTAILSGSGKPRRRCRDAVRLNLDPGRSAGERRFDTLAWSSVGCELWRANFRSIARRSGGGRHCPAWRLSSRVRGDSIAAVLEQIEFQYGRMNARSVAR